MQIAILKVSENMSDLQYEEVAALLAWEGAGTGRCP
jgi:hypothetical protein